MAARINLPMDQIRDFCKRWEIIEFALFGSVLRADFRDDSDVDVLVRFAPDAQWSLFDRMDMVDQLKAIFGRDVDLAIEDNLINPFRRKAILRSKETVYAA